MRTFPRARLDALTDGIFAFAMTLLVLEIRLPPGLPLTDGAALIAHLKALQPEYLAYVISFFVLVAQWRGTTELRRVEEINERDLGWAMVYLFFITGVPFSSSVVGHYGHLPPAVWLYATNLSLVAALSIRLRITSVVPEHRPRARFGHFKAVFFIATAALSALLSVTAPGYAMYAYLVNFAAGPLAERFYGDT